MSALDDFLFLLGDFDLVKDHGQLLKEAETELENLRKDAERLDNACKLALEIWGSPLYPLTVASIEMAREEHEELIINDNLVQSV